LIRAKLGEIAAWCGAVIPEPHREDEEIRGVSTDTRSLQPGELFVPLEGERHDGHDFVADAARAGAAAALWRRGRPMPEGGAGLPLLLVDDPLEALQKLAERYRASLKAKVVAVTGSNGKTTTKDLIASVLAARLRVHKTAGNLNNHIGLPLTLLRADPDTEALVVEMGMSGRGEISRLTRLAKPDVAVITNVGEAHLMQLGTRRNIARAKLEIAEGLGPGGVLVIPENEPLLKEELAASPPPAGVRVLTFGEGADSDARVGGIRVEVEGTSFRVAFGQAFEPNPAEPGRPAEPPEAEAQYRVPLTGRHNAVNAAAAAAVGRLFGLDAETIRRGLAEASVTGMRIERTAAWNGAVLLNDAYNASPTSVRAAIALVGELHGFKRKWLLLGDMLELGPEEAEMHAAIGREAASRGVDRLYAHGRLASHMAAEAARLMPEDGRVRHFDDKAALAAAVMEELDPADLVLVKASRGMKMEEVVRMLQAGPGGAGGKSHG
jgi:UDP-N-acetylmuramoyl-tripeptide--D-alanyl-D-alanine ligase